MILTAEISMYPFAEDYEPPIRAFIERLNTYEGFTIETSPTSTRVTGDYDAVMDMLREMFAWSYEAYGKAVYVTKFIPGYDPR